MRGVVVGSVLFLLSVVALGGLMAYSRRLGVPLLDPKERNAFGMFPLLFMFTAPIGLVLAIGSAIAALT